MKKIFFLRHAKSSWSDFSLKDFDRPLSTRGIQDAELMGNYFKAKKIGLDVIISSPSKRTKETLDHFFSSNISEIEYVQQIPQNGTGHAVLQLLPILNNFEGVVYCPFPL